MRIGANAALPAVLRNLGADPAKLFAEAGIDLKLFDDLDNRISLAARGHLIAHCAARTACPHLGLLVGQQAGLNSLGLVGLLTKTSPDVGTALRSLAAYFHLHIQGAVTTLAMEDNLAMLRYEIYQPRIEAVDLVSDGAVATAFNIVRDLCGPEWSAVEVRFAHREPENVAPFRRFFRAPLCFDTGQYSVVFSATWLKHRLSETSLQLRRMLQQEIDKLEVRHGDDFPEQVRGALRTALVSGHASAEQVAALFLVDRRTLHRRLSAFGASFRELVDEVSFEIARQLLEDSAMAVIEIAALLDYAGASAFTRAFRRWSGTTPAEWRAKRGG